MTAQTLRPIITANVDRASYLMTDESPVYWSIGRQFAGHGAVNHSAEEYVRSYFWHTNTVENYFSILKRGIYGLLFPRFGAAFASLHGRVRLPPQQPIGARYRRPGTR